MAKFLATVDRSRTSEAVLPALARFARAMSAQVELLLVAEPEPERARDSRGVAPPLATAGVVPVPAAAHRLEPLWAETKDQAVDRLLAEGRDYLEDIASGLRDDGLVVEEHVIIDHDPARAIIEFARHEQVDLILMATHGRTGLREAVQGSVAEAVVRSGVAPVLLVRPKE